MKMVINRLSLFQTRTKRRMRMTYWMS